MKTKQIVVLLLLFVLSFKAFSQIDDEKTGAWYMYFWNTKIKNSSFGVQGDIQYRNWNTVGDLEQLLLRGGVSYTYSNAKFVLGYAHITSGAYGDNNDTKQESRIYQEMLLPQKIGEVIFLKHRFRFEQRFVENQDFRTRYRYNLFVNIPLNKKNLDKGSIYLALYNEVFLNGQRNIGNGQTVEIFDVNRTYGAIGYSISNNIKAQLGYMKQTKNSFSKGQIQLSIHHKF